MFLHEGGVLRGKGKFEGVQYRPSLELPNEEFPLIMSTGRTLYHYNAATQTRRDPGTFAKQPESFIEMHRFDARGRGIADGDMARVWTRRGEVECRVIVSKQVKKGSIWMPLHFSEARANLLTNDAGDPVTGTAEYKVCAAQVQRLAGCKNTSEPFPGSFCRDPGA